MKKLLIALISTIVVYKLMHWQGSGLITSETPNGILALEFANDFLKVNSILSVWDVNIARINIVIDFFFLTAYSMFFIFSIQYIHTKASSAFVKNNSLILLKLALLPALFDAIENIIMLQTLARNSTTFLLQLTWYCVVIKFLLAAVITLFILIMLPVTILNRKK
jgi:hypothetical protein